MTDHMKFLLLRLAEIVAFSTSIFVSMWNREFLSALQEVGKLLFFWQVIMMYLPVSYLIERYLVRKVASELNRNLLRGPATFFIHSIVLNFVWGGFIFSRESQFRLDWIVTIVASLSIAVAFTIFDRKSDQHTQ